MPFRESNSSTPTQWKKCVMLVSLFWIYIKSAHHTHREPSMAFTILTLFSTQPRTPWKDTLPRDHEQFCLIRMPIKATSELSTSWLHFAPRSEVILNLRSNSWLALWTWAWLNSWQKAQICARLWTGNQRVKFITNSWSCMRVRSLSSIAPWFWRFIVNLTAFNVFSNSPYLPTAEESELKLMLWPVIADCLQSPTLRALIWPINMVRSRSATVFSPLYVLTGTLATTGNVGNLW